MTLDDLKTRLSACFFQISSEARIPNGTGTKISLTNGAVVNFFDTGRCNVQGKNQEAVQKCLGIPVTVAAVEAQSSNENPKPILSKVFVVYGHDKTARTDLEAMLRRWQLVPLILDQLPSGGQTIIEKLEKYTAEAKFAIILATPDDEGHRANRNEEKKFRARQNVVLELGMMLAKLGREKVAILLRDQENMDRPSDIHGLIYIPFQDDLQKEVGLRLAKEMIEQGYQISTQNL